MIPADNERGVGQTCSGSLRYEGRGNPQSQIPNLPRSLRRQVAQYGEKVERKSFNHKFCVCALFAAKLIMRKKQHRNGGKYD